MFLPDAVVEEEDEEAEVLGDREVVVLDRTDFVVDGKRHELMSGQTLVLLCQKLWPMSHFSMTD